MEVFADFVKHIVQRLGGMVFDSFMAIMEFCIHVAGSRRISSYKLMMKKISELYALKHIRSVSVYSQTSILQLW